MAPTRAKATDMRQPGLQKPVLGHAEEEEMNHHEIDEESADKWWRYWKRRKQEQNDARFDAMRKSGEIMEED